MPLRTFRFSAFTLDVENACVLHEGARLALSPKDFALLHHLVSHRSRVVPHAELLQAVWRETAVGPDVLKVRVRRLRRLLGDDAATPRFIASVHGEGYRFVAAVVSSPFGAEASPPTAPPRPPVIGREAELAQLQGLLREAASGRRRIVFVTGEPGIGKTTLIDEFVERSAPAAGVWIGRGQCVEHYGSGEPYLPVMEALGRLARTDAHERLENVLRRVAPSWLLELPALVESEEREALHPQSPPATRERRMRELAEALETLTTARVAASDPPLLVLALEDLHWTDPSTLELLAMLARRPDRARLMVVGKVFSAGCLAATMLRLMMRPPPCFFMCGIAARAVRMCANSLISRSFCHAASSTFSNGSCPVAPALLTTMSMRPKCFTVSSMNRSASPGLAASATTGNTSPPDFLSSSANALSTSGRRAQSATLTPSATSRSTVARPMPSLPPVTAATLPRNPSSMCFSPCEPCLKRNCDTSRQRTPPAAMLSLGRRPARFAKLAGP
jgi:DNA-binding winged helix-turn-helix (wHTH) protein